MSPVTANLFLEDFKTKYWFPIPTRHVLGRYVDDTIVIVKSDQIDSFTTHVNSQHKAIKFTIEKEVDNRIPVLDVLASKRRCIVTMATDQNNTDLFKRHELSSMVIHETMR